MKIVDHMPYDSDIRESIPAFHALTGSNTISYIAGYSRKSAWRCIDVSSPSEKPRKRLIDY